MPLFDFLIEWVDRSSPVTLFVMGLLSIYFITTVWVFVYRFLFLNRWLKIEKDYTQILLKDIYQENKNIFFYNRLNVFSYTMS
jgi:hypothetical protein